MATGGEVAGVKMQQSDAVHEYTCSTCSKNDVTTEATHYCPECDVCYCKACLCDHAVLGRSKVEQWGKTEDTRDNAKAVEQEDTCLRHPDHTVTLYCEYHDVLCCPICSYTDHRSCKKLAKIRAAAEKDNISDSVKKVDDEIASLKINTETLANNREISKQFLERSYTNYVQQLGKLQETINAKFDATKEDARRRKQHYMEQFGTDKQLCESITRKLTGLTENTKLNQDKQDYFVKLKRTGEWARNKHESVQSMLNATVTEVFTRVEEVRAIKLISGIIDVKMAEMRFSIETRGDVNACELSGLCQIANGHTIIADKANKCLKQLDETYSVITRHKLQYNPCGICAVGDTEIAVTMDTNKLLIVDVGIAFENVRTLELDHPCTNVAYHDEKLYVTNTPSCSISFKCTCNTKIHIYDKSGKALGQMTAYFGKHDLSDRVSRYMRSSDNVGYDNGTPLCISEDGEKIYVAHRCGLAVLDSQGGEIASSQDFTDIVGLCVDNKGYVYVSERESNKVVKLSQEGTGGFKRVKTVTSSLDGTTATGAICFDKRLGRIVICQEKGNYIYLEKLAY